MIDESNKQKYAELWRAVHERDRNLRIHCKRVAARHQRDIVRLCSELDLDPSDYVVTIKFSRNDI